MIFGNIIKVLPWKQARMKAEVTDAMGVNWNTFEHDFTTYFAFNFTFTWACFCKHEKMSYYSLMFCSAYETENC